jgi:hypothetical protein
LQQLKSQEQAALQQFPVKKQLKRLWRGQHRESEKKKKS